MNTAERNGPSAKALEALDRISMVFGAIFAERSGGGEQGEKARRLKLLGFSNSQIAAMLGTTTNTVNVALHHAKQATCRKGKGRPSKRGLARHGS